MSIYTQVPVGAISAKTGTAAHIDGIRSLDYIYRRDGSVPIEVVGKVAEAVLKGLMYLYDVHRIIHRGVSQSFGHSYSILIISSPFDPYNAISR